jgi:hypothetical protein
MADKWTEQDAVMAGKKREARLRADVPAIHVLMQQEKRG